MLLLITEPSDILHEAVADLQSLFPDNAQLITVDCLDSAIDEVCQLIRDQYSEANKLVSELDKLFNNIEQQMLFTTRTNLPEIPKQFFESILYCWEHFAALEKYFKVQGSRAQTPWTFSS